jgi:hypothetical protein
MEPEIYLQFSYWTLPVSQMNPVHTFPPYFSKNNFNIILPSTSLSSLHVHRRIPYLRQYYLMIYNLKSAIGMQQSVSKLFFQVVDSLLWVACSCYNKVKTNEFLLRLKVFYYLTELSICSQVPPPPPTLLYQFRNRCRTVEGKILPAA